MARPEGETYFNNFQQSGYDELRSWTPVYYRDIREAEANFRFAGWLKDTMAEALEEFCRNQFASTMGEYMLSRMEEFFYLTGNRQLSLDERRRLLSIAMSGTGKMSREKIADIVRTYTGAEANFMFPASVFQIYVELAEDGPIYSAAKLMREIARKIPAHLKYIAHFNTVFPFDFSDRETVRIVNLNIGMKLPFVKGYLLDGKRLFDGSFLLNGSYGETITISFGMGFSVSLPESGSICAVIRWRIRPKEKLRQQINYGMSVHEREKQRHYFASSFKMKTEEKLPMIQLISKSASSYLLNGDMLLDGSGGLNSTYKKEVIE